MAEPLLPLSLSSPPSESARIVPSTASTMTTAMIARVRRGTTSVMDARTGAFDDPPGRCGGTPPAAEAGEAVGRAGADGAVRGAGGAAGVDAEVATATPAPAAGAAFALRTERNAPRRRSRATSPASPSFDAPLLRGAATRPGSAITWVESAGGGTTGAGLSAAWITSLSRARAPASSSRCSGSLASRP